MTGARRARDGGWARLRMCSVGWGDVFSFLPNVFSFRPNVFTSQPNVFTSEGHVFSFRRRASPPHGPLRQAQGRLFGDAGMTGGAGGRQGERALACVHSVGPMCPVLGLMCPVLGPICPLFGLMCSLWRAMCPVFGGARPSVQGSAGRNAPGDVVGGSWGWGVARDHGGCLAGGIMERTGAGDEGCRQ